MNAGRVAECSVAVALVIGLTGCGKPQSGTTKAALPSQLAATQWRLVEIQSMDDAVGVKRPSGTAQYTMQLGADGKVTMKLNCNSANGTWSAQQGPESASGKFEYGPLAMTRAMCPPPSLDTQIASQAQYVRSYLLKDGRLHLSLMADGGIQVWERQ